MEIGGINFLHKAAAFVLFRDLAQWEDTVDSCTKEWSSNSAVQSTDSTNLSVRYDTIR